MSTFTYVGYCLFLQMSSGADHYSWDILRGLRNAYKTVLWWRIVPYYHCWWQNKYIVRFSVHLIQLMTTTTNSAIWLELACHKKCHLKHLTLLTHAGGSGNNLNMDDVASCSKKLCSLLQFCKPCYAAVSTHWAIRSLQLRQSLHNTALASRDKKCHSKYPLYRNGLGTWPSR